MGDVDTFDAPRARYDSMRCIRQVELLEYVQGARPEGIKQRKECELGSECLLARPGSGRELREYLRDTTHRSRDLARR